MLEQQKFLERIQKENNKDKIFISGIPAILKNDMSDVAENDGEDEVVDDHERIIHHILNFVHPGINKESYNIIKNFEPKVGHTRHSAKISVEDKAIRTNIFKGCKNFKDVDATHYMKKVFIKNDDPPLTRKEKERLYAKMKELRQLEDINNPVNKYHIKENKLFKNGHEEIDEFNINNQLFQ